MPLVLNPGVQSACPSTSPPAQVLPIDLSANLSGGTVQEPKFLSGRKAPSRCSIGTGRNDRQPQDPGVRGRARRRPMGRSGRCRRSRPRDLLGCLRTFYSLVRCVHSRRGGLSKLRIGTTDLSALSPFPIAGTHLLSLSAVNLNASITLPVRSAAANQQLCRAAMFASWARRVLTVVWGAGLAVEDALREVESSLTSELDGL